MESTAKCHLFLIVYDLNKPTSDETAFTLSNIDALPWGVLGTVYDSRAGENHILHKL